MRRDFDKHDDAANAYEKALLKFRHSGGSQGYEPSRPHPGNPPPAWTRQIPTFPHETGSLCGRLISCMLDRRESSEDGRLAFPRNKAEAANGDFVWVPECALILALLALKWQDADWPPRITGWRVNGTTPRPSRRTSPTRLASLRRCRAPPSSAPPSAPVPLTICSRTTCRLLTNRSSLCRISCHTSACSS